MITHLSPLNGKLVKFSSASIANHVKHHCRKTGDDFESSKQKFMDSLPKVYCENCDSLCKIQSNLKYVCSSRICRQRSGTPSKYKTSKRFFGESAEKYIDFILDNLDIYLNNLKSKIPDPYDGLEGNFTLECKMKRRLPSWKTEPRFQKTVNCISCLKPRTVNLFSSHTDSCSKSCASVGISRNKHRNFVKLFDLAFGDFNRMTELLSAGYDFDSHVVKCAKDMGLSEIKLYQLDLISKPGAEIVLIEDIVFISVPGKYRNVRISRQAELMGIDNLFEENCLICGDKFIPYRKNSRFCSHTCYHESLKLENFSKFHSVENRETASNNQSLWMKSKIASGEFTPTITNSWCKNRIHYIIDGKEYKFRSSWEAVFFLFNQHLEYEKHRIPYKTPDGKHHIYITDFTDEISKIIYEIKPTGLFSDPIVILKQTVAEQWCQINGYSYVQISDSWFRDICSDQHNRNKIVEYLNYNVKSMKQFF